MTDKHTETPYTILTATDSGQNVLVCGADDGVGGEK